MRLRFFSCFLGAVLPALAVTPLPGQALNATVTPDSKIRYADLLRLIFPDLAFTGNDAVKATATGAPGIRELGASDPPAASQDEIEIASIDIVAFLKSGPRVLLSFVTDLNDMRCVALFDLSAAPRILDVVAVPGFPDDLGSLESTLRLNSATDAYVFSAHHSNSSQAYSNYTVFFCDGRRIQKILDVGILSSHTSGDLQDFEETAAFAVTPEPGSNYAAVTVRAVQKFLPDDPQGPHRPLRRGYTRTYAATYRWDASAGKFSTASTRIAELEAFNHKNN